MVKAQAGSWRTTRADAAEAEAAGRASRASSTRRRARWVAAPAAADRARGEAPEGDRRGETFAAWRRYFEGLAEQRPLVLVFEDLHWADDGLLDFVDHLVDWSTGVPLLVVGTARPELLDRRPGWGGGKMNARRSRCRRSPTRGGADHPRGPRAGGAPGRDPAGAARARRWQPALCRAVRAALVERGAAEDLPLPETVQGIIAARLDGLAPEEKGLLQDAAVLGKVFWSGACGAPGARAGRVGQRSTRWSARGWSGASAAPSVSGEDEYAFRHVLVRDVAYGQIPRAARARKASCGPRSGSRRSAAPTTRPSCRAPLRRRARARPRRRRGRLPLRRARVAFCARGDRGYRLGACSRGALRFCDRGARALAAMATRAGAGGRCHGRAPPPSSRATAPASFDAMRGARAGGATRYRRRSWRLSPRTRRGARTSATRPTGSTRPTAERATRGTRAVSSHSAPSSRRRRA